MSLTLKLPRVSHSLIIRSNTNNPHYVPIIVARAFTSINSFNSQKKTPGSQDEGIDNVLHFIEDKIEAQLNYLPKVT